MSESDGKEHLGNRTKYIGASDAPAILGLDRFRTPYDVWLEKTGRIPQTDLTGNKAAEAGIILEPSVLDFAEKHIGKIKRKIEVPGEGLGYPLVVHLDGITVDGGDPVEAKTSGLFSPLAIEWGEDGTDEVPDYVAIQAQTQLIPTKSEINHIPAFLGGKGFVMYWIEKADELQQIINDRLGIFWNDHVLKDTPPLDSLPSLDLAGKIYREPGSLTEIDPVILDLYLETIAAEKATSKFRNAAKASLLAALGDTEAGTVDGVVRVTYFEQERKEHIVRASKFRMLRPKKVGK
jgi:putative phage-type endonuclease